MVAGLVSPLFATLANLAGAVWGACWVALGTALLTAQARVPAA